MIRLIGSQSYTEFFQSAACPSIDKWLYTVLVPPQEAFQDYLGGKITPSRVRVTRILTRMGTVMVNDWFVLDLLANQLRELGIWGSDTYACLVALISILFNGAVSLNTWYLVRSRIRGKLRRGMVTLDMEVMTLKLVFSTD